MKLTQAKIPCACCNKVDDRSGWWLTDYHGISGYYCPDCYNKVAHDSYGNPTNPTEYMFVLLKQRAYNVSKMD